MGSEMSVEMALELATEPNTSRCTLDAMVMLVLAARVRELTPEPGHIVDETGVKCPVIGTLRKTRDGSVIGENAPIWIVMDHREGKCLGLGRVQYEIADDWDETEIDGFASQEAAKEAAGPPPENQCHNCQTWMVRSGKVWKCLNCGATRAAAEAARGTQ